MRPVLRYTILYVQVIEAHVRAAAARKEVSRLAAGATIVVPLVAKVTDVVGMEVISQ